MQNSIKKGIVNYNGDLWLSCTLNDIALWMTTGQVRAFNWTQISFLQSFEICLQCLELACPLVRLSTDFWRSPHQLSNPSKHFLRSGVPGPGFDPLCPDVFATTCKTPITCKFVHSHDSYYLNTRQLKSRCLSKQGPFWKKCFE